MKRLVILAALIAPLTGLFLSGLAATHISIADTKAAESELTISPNYTNNSDSATATVTTTMTPVSVADCDN